MAKRPVKGAAKKVAPSASPTIPLPVMKYPCKIKGCEKWPAYMRVEKNPSGDDGRSHYCAEHWRTYVEEPRSKANIETVAHFKKTADKRVGGLKKSVKRAKK